MLFGQSENGKRSIASGLVFLFLFSILSAMVPASPGISSVDVLADERIVAPVSVPEQTYELYLDSPTSETGGQGSITTIEPNTGQEEGSAIDGLEFRSAEMISDLYINGSGSSNTARLSVYIQFRGAEGSTADVTFSLKSGDTQIDSQNRQLEDSCSPNPFTGGGCDWTIIEVEFDAGANGFMVAKGKQLKIRIDAQATCEGNTGGVGGGDCAVDIAFGKMENSGGFSRLQIMTNALSGSSVRVHSCNEAFGCNWNDAQKFEWSPNHRPDFREMQFSVEVRDAFGRDDIEEVNLIMDTPNGANVVFDKNFEDDDFKLDNNGLVGNFTYTYEAGIDAGDYPIRLEVEDVQGHSVVFEHPGITMLENDIYLTLPSNQPDVVLFAPGAVVQVELLVEHTGSSSSSIDVIFDLETNLPSSWSDPQWSAPSSTYTLNGGGSSVIPELQLEVPEGDLDSAPDSLEIEARVYAQNSLGQNEEVAIRTISLDFEEVDVFAPPRIFVYEDEEHQKQIADSTRSEAYDETLSHYVDADEVGDFFIDVFNTGFQTDAFKIRILEQPDDWQYRFYDNDTGLELVEEGIYSITPDIGSTQILTIRMEVYPPADRDGVDIGLFEIAVSSKEDSELRTDVAFTVHRTFGILVEVISDSDGTGQDNPLGQVGPVTGDATIYFNLRITDSSDTGSGSTTWKIVNPRDVEQNAENNPKYAAWDYTISNGSNSNLVAVNLAPDEYIDMKLEITLRGQVEAGEHTVYTRIIEEGVEIDDARYFDLPVKVVIQEEVIPNRLEITDKTEKSRFAPGEAKNLEYRISNQNNIPLDVVIRLDQPDGWDGAIRATSSQTGSDFLIINLPAYSSKDFSVTMVAPEDLKDSEEAQFEFRVTPMNNETPFDDAYVQKFTFSYMTECSGANCLFRELVNPEPQTIVFYVVLLALLFYARGRSGRSEEAYDDASFYDDFEKEVEPIDDEDDLPAPVLAQEDEDDELELLEELEDL
tara:strand:+ start:1058 stop:4012 length:2955 start_codon:yes stop_codon:yes gene_type:complete